MLTTYQTQTYELLQLTSAAAAKLYTADQLTGFINQARFWISGESECIRNFATLPIASGARSAAFTSIVLGAPSAGIAGALHVRQSWADVGDGLVLMTGRPFSWMGAFGLNRVVPQTGLPATWAQYAQGVQGSLYVDPLPDRAYVLTVDTVCYPIDLVDDATVEAIPAPWTHCVPFYAAYYALLGAQRLQDAEMMLRRYEAFAQKARGMSNPDLLPSNFLMSQDMTLGNKLGIAGRGVAPGGGQ